MASLAVLLIHCALGGFAAPHSSQRPWLAPPSSKSPMEFDYFHYGPVVDVRETQLIRENDQEYVNSHWVAHWITTKTDLDLLVVSHVSLRSKGDHPEGSNLYGGSVYELDSGFFSDYFAVGETASVDPDVLDIQFKGKYRWFANSPDSFSSITTIGNWDDHAWNITFEPRGPNLYDGGSAAFFWGTDYNREWAAPNALTTGTVTINTGGRNTYLCLGRESCWELSQGIWDSAEADGSHEVVTVLPDLQPKNAWVSKDTNITYYESFTLSFPEKKGRLDVSVPYWKEKQHGEFGAEDRNVALYEAYAQVDGLWEGKQVSGWTVSEQKPFYG